MAKDVIGIKFEVEGGESISGWSGQKIKNQLESIVKQIKPSVKIDINQEYFDNQLKALSKKIQEDLGKLEVDLKYKKGEGVASPKNNSVSQGKQSTANAQVANATKLQSQLDALYETYKKLDAVQESEINKRAELASLAAQQEAAYEQAMQAARHSGEVTEQQYNRLLLKEAELLAKRENGRRIAEEAANGTAKDTQIAEEAVEDEAKSVEEVVKKHNDWITAARTLEKELKKLNGIQDRNSEVYKEQHNIVENAQAKYNEAGGAGYAEQIKKETNLTNKQIAATNKLCDSIEKLDKVKKERETIPFGKRTVKEIDDIKKQEKSYAGLIAKLENLRVSNSYLIKNNKEAAAAMAALDDVAKKGFDGSSFGNAKQSIFDLDLAIKETDATLKRIGDSADTFGFKLREAFETKVVQNLAYALLALATNAFNQVYHNVINLDNAVTDLQIATGKTREETAKLVKGYAKLAQELGATATDVTNAADTWLRQGYKTAEVNTLITNTLKLAKLGQLDSAEAAKALTSAMKGYNYEVEKSIDIVDKFTAVDMEAATSAGDIATAMAETAVSANTAGVSMDNLIGYIATVAEVTQDGAESVGTFYKTMFARMSNIKAGKFVDDETGESLNDVAATLGQVGIALFDTEGEFREFEVVLDEIGAAWDGLNSVQRAAIATAMAGTRQTEKFRVLMENYATAKEYADTAANSVGTATSKYNEAYLDSITAKLEQLQAAWQEFSANLLDSTLVKGIVDFLKLLVNGLNFIVEHFDTGSIAATALFIIIERLGIKAAQYVGNVVKEIAEMPLALKKAEEAAQAAETALLDFLNENSNGQSDDEIRAIVDGIKDQTIATGDLGKQLGLNEEQQIKLKNLTDQQKTATIDLQKTQEKQLITQYNLLTSVIAAGNLFSNLLGSIDGEFGSWTSGIAGIITGIGAITLACKAAATAISTAEKASIILTLLSIGASALSMVVNAFQELADAEKKQYEAAKKAYEEQKELAEQKKKDAKDLNELAEEYKELIKDQDDISALNAESKERLQELQEKINGLATAEYKNSDLINQSLEKRLDLLNKIIEAKDREAEKDAVEAYRAAKETLDEAYDGHGFLPELKYGDGFGVGFDIMEGFNISFDKSESGEAGKYADKIAEVFQNKNSIIAQESYSWLDDPTSFMDDAMRGVGLLHEFQWNIGFANDATIEEISRDFKAALDEIYNNVELMRDEGSADLYYALKEYYDTEIAPLATLLQGAAIDVGEASLSRLAREVETSVISANKDIGKFEDELVKKLTEYLNTYATDHGLSEEQIQNLVKNYIRTEYSKEYAEQNAQQITYDFKTILAAIQGGYDIIRDAMDDMDELNIISADMISDVLKENPDLEKYFEKTADGYKLVEGALTSYIEAMRSIYGQGSNAFDFNAVIATLGASDDIEEWIKVQENLIKGLETELDKQKELIDIRKDLLQTYKDEADYKEELAKKEKSVANLRTQLALAQLDNSAAGQARARELSKELEDAEDELDDYTLEHAIEILTDRMDSGYKEYESFIQDQVTRIEEAIAIAAKKYKEAQEGNGEGDNSGTGGEPPKYHTGGIVGGVSIGRNEEFAKLLDGEHVSTPRQIQNFMNKTMPKIAQQGSGKSINYNAPLVEIKCDNVTKEALPDLEKVVDRAVQKIKREVDSAFSRTGYRKDVK